MSPQQHDSRLLGQPVPALASAWDSPNSPSSGKAPEASGSPPSTLGLAKGLGSSWRPLLAGRDPGLLRARGPSQAAGCTEATFRRMTGRR